MSALLEARGVSKAFAGVRAVDDASLTVESGSITALIGPNGAGKSTLFNCISGFVRPDHGHIELAGRRIDRRPPHRIVRAGLGRTFQTARALTRMTVLDNVRLAAPAHPGERLWGVVARRAACRRRELEVTEQAHELLRLVRLDGHANALSGTLSGGQRKLLDLARILMAAPRLILLDEPDEPKELVRLLGHLELAPAGCGAACDDAPEALAGVCRGCEAHVVEHRHPRQRAGGLERPAEACPHDPVRRPPVDALAGELDPARVGSHEAGDAVEERRLPGAVRPDERRDRADLDHQRGVVDGPNSGEGLAHAAYLEQRAHSSTISSRRPRRPCGRKTTSRMITSPISMSRTYARSAESR